MNATAQLEKFTVVRDAPRLTVEWSSRWEEFVGSIQPALARSEARLAGEAPFGLIPLRIMIPSYVLEGFLILLAVFVYTKIEELRPTVAQNVSPNEVIYYSGDELPRTEDLGGSETGTTGRAGGNQAHHRTQTIKVARGNSLVPKVVDAPNLKLPSTLGAVANLLAIKPNPGPPPAEGMHSSRSAPNLASNLVAPAPNEVRDYTRNGIHLDPVVAPAPSITRDRPLTAPTLDARLAAPAPNITGDRTLIAPALAPIVAPPAANVSRDRALVAPTLSPSVAAPAQDVDRRDPFRTPPALASNVIPPAPAAVSHQLSSAPVRVMDPAVVPPPVSAPERATTRNSKLSMPAPAVVAPPPSADVSSDLRRLSSGSVPDASRAVVPPPPTQSGGGSFMSSLIGRIFGPGEVAAPPAAINAKSNPAVAPSLPANVVPPPAASTAVEATGNPRGNRNGLGASLESNVLAPPPSTGVTGGTGRSRTGTAPYAGNPTVLPPPPTLAGAGGGTGVVGGGAGTSSGTLAMNVVPPPPAVGGGPSASGSGLGRRGTGLGAPLDPGANLSPANTAGSGKEAGTIVSDKPGSTVGVPPSGAMGSLSMSPTGGDKAGLGGAGEGNGIGHGDGNGSGINGAATGAAKSGSGRGSDPNAHGGISPASGPGGAGTTPAGTPAVRGVDISGGTGVVTLPSFGSDPGSANPNASPGHEPVRQHSQVLGVTVVATASSGGAFEPYKNLLRGEKYTTYFETSLGTVVMEFADQSAPSHSFGTTLSAPVPIRTDLANGLPRARMVITCTLDAYGNVKNPRVLEAGPNGMTSKVLAALPGWKFQPAMRNNQPVEVTAILGFAIDTNDRF